MSNHGGFWVAIALQLRIHLLLPRFWGLGEAGTSGAIRQVWSDLSLLVGRNGILKLLSSHLLPTIRNDYPLYSKIIRSSIYTIRSFIFFLCRLSLRLICSTPSSRTRFLFNKLNSFTETRIAGFPEEESWAARSKDSTHWWKDDLLTKTGFTVVSWFVQGFIQTLCAFAV